jgi:hypothetical protein
MQHTRHQAGRFTNTIMDYCRQRRRKKDCYLSDMVVLGKGGGIVDPDVGHLHGGGRVDLVAGGRRRRRRVGRHHGLLGRAEGGVA